jgi:hypothetical protein
MVLLGHETQVDARFGPFGDSIILVQDRCMEIVVGCTRWISKVTLVMWNLVSIHLETVLVSVQDMCIVCSKHTIGLEIIVDTPGGTPR